MARSNPSLGRLWKVLRTRLGAFGFGRHELLPVRIPEAAGKYLGKYLGKGCGEGVPSAGSTRYVGDWRLIPSRVEMGGIGARGWSWTGVGARVHRAVVGGLARAAGHFDPGEPWEERLSETYGKRWCFWAWKAHSIAVETADPWRGAIAFLSCVGWPCVLPGRIAEGFMVALKAREDFAV
jgi:hypothetical protein